MLLLLAGPSQDVFLLPHIPHSHNVCLMHVAAEWKIGKFPVSVETQLYAADANHLNGPLTTFFCLYPREQGHTWRAAV